MDLSIKITGDGRGAQQAIRGVAGDLKGLDSGLASVAQGIPGVSSALAAMANPAALLGTAMGATAAAAGAMGAALAQAVADTVRFGDDIGDLSAQLGIGAESLQTLQYAAERSGGSADSLRGAVKALTKSLSEAQDGGSKTAALFNALGVATTDAAGAMRPVEDVLRDVIGALGDLGPGTEQAAAASELLGRSYQDLLPLIKQGRDGMAELEANARALGGVMSEEDVAAASALDDALVDLKFATTGLWHEIGGALVPVLTDAADALLGWIKSGELASAAVDGMKIAVSGLVSAIPGIGGVLSGAMPYLIDWAASSGKADDALMEFAGDAEGESEDASGHGRYQARLEAIRGVMAGLKEDTKAAAASVAAAGVTLGSAADQMTIEDEPVTLGSAVGDIEIRNDPDVIAQTDAANDSQIRLADSTRDTAAAFGQATTAAGDLFGTIIEGANTGHDKTLTLTAQIVRLGAQVVAQIASSTAAAISASASTATAQVASNTAIATSAGIAGGAQSTATYGASAGAGAAAFIGALASIGGAVASFVAGVADAGVGPDDLRRAGLLRHSVLAVRNDERVLSPTSSRYVDEMMEAYRAEGRVGGQQQSVRIDSPIMLDGRQIGRFVDEHLITSEERGRSYRDRIRQPYRGAA